MQEIRHPHVCPMVSKLAELAGVTYTIVISVLLIETATNEWTGNGPGPLPQVPGMTAWGILAAGIILAVLIPLALRRRKLSSTGG